MMKVIKMKEENRFGLIELSFLELKTIKEACKLFGKQGSIHAIKIFKKIDTEMNNITI